MRPATVADDRDEDAPVPAAADDGEAPEWPDEAVEASMLAEQRERDDSGDRSPRPTPRAAPTAPVDAAPLPPLDHLVAQIPPQVRETIDELFRARFTSVQRVPDSALKSS